MIKLKSLRVANKDELIKETGRKWDWDCYEVDDFAEAVDNLIWVVENCIIKNEDCYVTKDGLSFNMIKKFKRPKGHIDDIEYSFLETRNKFDTAIFYWEWFEKSVMLQYTDLGEFDNVRKSPCFIRVLTADELEDVKNLYIERFEAETGLVVNG